MAKAPLRARNTKMAAILSHLNRKKRTKMIIVLVVFTIVLVFFATGQRGTIQLISFTKQKYDLENEKLFLSPARGLSNVFTAETARIDIKEGKLLIIKEI